MTVTEKIELPAKPSTTFSERERHLNVTIQKKLDEFRRNGFNVSDHKVVNKSVNSATVSFTVQRMPQG